MRAPVIGRHYLPVLPHSENERKQEDQARRQQGDLGVDSESGAQGAVEFSCAS
jgi:hypothetical protein